MYTLRHLHSSEVNLAISIPSQQLYLEWISEAVEIPPFRRLVVSWNSKTHSGAGIEVWVRVRTSLGWSTWLSYGKWTTDGMNTGSFSGQRDAIARLDIDELHTCQHDGNAVQVKAVLSRKHVDIESPLLKSVSITARPHADSPDMPPGFHEGAYKSLAVPSIPQLAVPDIGNVICSPTSLTMLMAYYGVALPLETVCTGTLDNGTAIYGNWSYNIAYASENGFLAHVTYCEHFTEVLAAIQKDMPVIITVKMTRAEALTGALQAYPYGHLLVVTGYEQAADGSLYILANDPACRDAAEVKRRYLYSELNAVWQHLAYCIVPLSKGVTRTPSS